MFKKLFERRLHKLLVETFEIFKRAAAKTVNKTVEKNTTKLIYSDVEFEYHHDGIGWVNVIFYEDWARSSNSLIVYSFHYSPGSDITQVITLNNNKVFKNKIKTLREVLKSYGVTPEERIVNAHINSI
jgi:hypothetical protein